MHTKTSKMKGKTTKMGFMVLQWKRNANLGFGSRNLSTATRFFSKLVSPPAPLLVIKPLKTTPKTFARTRWYRSRPTRVLTLPEAN